MELLDAIYKRRTVRKFKQNQVSDDIINGILEAGTWAPSHGNNQPWEFILIGPETRQKLLIAYREYMEAGPLKNPALPEERKQLMRSFMQNFGGAPLIMAIACPPPANDLERYDFPLSSAAAIQNILLAAWEKEVAGVWLSFGNSPQAQSILGINQGETISGILCMGYPEIIPPAQPRISVSEKKRMLP